MYSMEEVIYVSLKKPVSEILKKRRKEIKLSAQDVCDILKETDGIDISVSTLYGYENGHRKPTPETLLALCDIYDLDNISVSFGYSNSVEAALDSGYETFSQFKNDNKAQLNYLYSQLNNNGQTEAVKRVGELTRLTEYRRTEEPKTPSDGDNES